MENSGNLFNERRRTTCTNINCKTCLLKVRTKSANTEIFNFADIFAKQILGIVAWPARPRQRRSLWPHVSFPRIQHRENGPFFQALIFYMQNWTDTLHVTVNATSLFRRENSKWPRFLAAKYLSSSIYVSTFVLHLEHLQVLIFQNKSSNSLHNDFALFWLLILTGFVWIVYDNIVWLMTLLEPPIKYFQTKEQ